MSKLMEKIAALGGLANGRILGGGVKSTIAHILTHGAAGAASGALNGAAAGGLVGLVRKRKEVK